MAEAIPSEIPISQPQTNGIDEFNEHLPFLTDGIKRSEAMDRALRELDEDGVTVIPDVMTPDECNEQIKLIHQWLNKFHPRWPDNFSSIIKKYNIGFCETLWAGRFKAKETFAEIYGTEKLLTSFDGMAVATPPEDDDSTFKFAKKAESPDGLHMDQGPSKKGFHVFQGALYLEEAEEEDYCFKVMKNSHKYHSKFFENNNPNPRDEFMKLSGRQASKQN